MTDAPDAATVDAAAAACREFAIVVDAAVTHSDPRQGGRRTVEILLADDCVRVPPRVLKTLYDHDLGIADTTPQGGFLVAVAT